MRKNFTASMLLALGLVAQAHAALTVHDNPLSNAELPIGPGDANTVVPIPVDLLSPTETFHSIASGHYTAGAVTFEGEHLAIAEVYSGYSPRQEMNRLESYRVITSLTADDYAAFMDGAIPRFQSRLDGTISGHYNLFAFSLRNLDEWGFYAVEEKCPCPGDPSVTVSFQTNLGSYSYFIDNPGAVTGSWLGAPTTYAFSLSKGEFFTGFSMTSAYSGAGMVMSDAVLANLTPAVPEPETYALMWVGLGLIGFAAYRRKVSERDRLLRFECALAGAAVH